MEKSKQEINWNLSKIIAAISGISWIAIQITVPSYWLIERGFDPKPRQFGWQMYTNMAGGDRFQIINQNNSIEEINPEDYAHNIRPGLNYGANFLAYLCQKFPDSKQTQRISIRDSKPYIYQCQK